jgi:hypothetical protein
LRAQVSEDGLSSRNFEALSRYIYDYSGIKMPITKLTMLEGRLRRRLRATGIPSFNAYCDYLFKHDGIEKEAIFLIDAVTTNKTDFFRVDRASGIPAAAQHRPASHAARPAAKPAASAVRKSDNSVNAQQARARGFALDMSMGGPDADDADFRESA